MRMVLDLFFNSLYVIFSVIVSITFWVFDSNKGWYRFIASIHSIMLLLILIVALQFGLGLKMYNTLLLTITFYTMLLLSLISIVINVVIFEGSKWFHLLHVWTAFAFITTLFVGTMSITNDWL